MRKLHHPVMSGIKRGGDDPQDWHPRYSSSALPEAMSEATEPNFHASRIEQACAVPSLPAPGMHPHWPAAAGRPESISAAVAICQVPRPPGLRQQLRCVPKRDQSFGHHRITSPGSGNARDVTDALAGTHSHSVLHRLGYPHSTTTQNSRWERRINIDARASAIIPIIAVPPHQRYPGVRCSGFSSTVRSGSQTTRTGPALVGRLDRD